MLRSCLATLTFIICVTACDNLARAQFGESETKGPQFGEERVQKWKVGLMLTARGGPCTGIYGHVSVPTDWPEQNVRVVDEDISDTVGNIQYRFLDASVRLMTITVPQLAPGERATALVTVEVTTKTVLAPADPSILRLPKTPPRNIRKCLAVSPLIESRSSKIRSKVKEITEGQERGWDTVQSIHDWVKENIEHRKGSLKGAQETLSKGYGNHEDLTNLFIAFCRAAKIPARTVWVPKYCYAEFYLEDDDGKGYWFPCELKEKTEFGQVSEPYPILQKGDNIRVWYTKELKRFVPEYLTVKRGSKPTHNFFRQAVH